MNSQYIFGFYLFMLLEALLNKVFLSGLKAKDRGWNSKVNINPKNFTQFCPFFIFFIDIREK